MDLGLGRVVGPHQTGVCRPRCRPAQGPAQRRSRGAPLPAAPWQLPGRLPPPPPQPGHHDTWKNYQSTSTPCIAMVQITMLQAQLCSVLIFPEQQLEHFVFCFMQHICAFFWHSCHCHPLNWIKSGFLTCVCITSWLQPPMPLANDSAVLWSPEPENSKVQCFFTCCRA